MPTKILEAGQELKKLDTAKTPPNYQNVQIGIYSLQEQAAKRASEILSNTYPKISVKTNNDHVCTDRLRSLSKNSDVFVFSWRSSKHQAFYCVKEHQPKDKILLQPPGKGCSSLVTIVAENIHRMETQ